MERQRKALFSFFKMAIGISVEIFATIFVMAVIFVVGFLILMRS